MVRSENVATIFLDRDGVINENRSDYVKSWSEFRFVPGSLEAISRLTNAGHRIVVCTNQAGIARGYLTEDTVEDIHCRMLAKVMEVGGRIEKIYYCPHGKDACCTCRKPRPGMLLRACDELGVDLSEAIFVGDSITDMRAGQAVGVCCMLVLTGLGADQLLHHYQEGDQPFLVASDLRKAAESILRAIPTASTRPLAHEDLWAMLQSASSWDREETLVSHSEPVPFPA